MSTESNLEEVSDNKLNPIFYTVNSSIMPCKFNFHRIDVDRDHTFTRKRKLDCIPAYTTESIHNNITLASKQFTKYIFSNPKEIIELNI